MAFFEWFNQIDTQFLLTLNGWNNDYFDHFFTLFTSKETWYPLYLFLVVLIFKKYKVKGLWVVIFFVLAIVASDQISGLIKDIVQRFRPSHEPSLLGLINLPAGKGGSYGFLSGHATNSFALAILVGLLTKSRRLWAAFFVWAILTSYSRIYVGVHYPFDVFAGALLGGFIGWGAFLFLHFFDSRFQQKGIMKIGRWESKYSNSLLLALFFITITLLVVAQLIGKYY